MSNGIKMSDCRFYIDEDARTIVCVIPNTQNMVEDFIRDHFYFHDFDFGYAMNRPLQEKIKMPKSFMGKAVCAPDDEWNVETGSLLAYARAKDKCYRSFFKRANLYAQAIDNRLNNIIDEFNHLGLRLEAKRTDLEERIKATTGEEV